jgi:GT2 family glycosyltransferase
MKPVAIVILNFNGEKMLKNFFPLVATRSQFDLLVVDNASTDGSLDFLKNKYPAVRIIQLSENFGYAAGYNFGLAQIEGQYDYYILLNSDVEVTDGWDMSLISWMKQHPGYSAVQPKLLSWKDKSKFDYAGAGGGFLDWMGYPYCRGRIWDVIEPDTGQYDDAIQVDWASGACFVVKAEIFHQLGGFDPHFFAHMEEIDLCWRMRQRGWKIGYVGSVAVFHLGGATLDRASPRKLYLNIRNSLYMLYKLESPVKFSILFLGKGILENVASIFYMVSGKKELGRAIRKGYVDFLKTKKNLTKLRLGSADSSVRR